MLRILKRDKSDASPEETVFTLSIIVKPEAEAVCNSHMFEVVYYLAIEATETS